VTRNDSTSPKMLRLTEPISIELRLDARRRRRPWRARGVALPILILSGDDRPPAFGNLNSYQNSSGEEKGTPLSSSLPASGERGQTQPERSLLGRIFISPARMGRRRILPHTRLSHPKNPKSLKAGR
jgi:hypothetical protein